MTERYHAERAGVVRDATSLSVWRRGLERRVRDALDDAIDRVVIGLDAIESDVRAWEHHERVRSLRRPDDDHGRKHLCVRRQRRILGCSQTGDHEHEGEKKSAHRTPPRPVRPRSVVKVPDNPLAMHFSVAAVFR